jgi:uncharacterized protein (TIGR04255 family)
LDSGQAGKDMAERHTRQLLDYYLETETGGVMAATRKLKRAPVREALIDIQFVESDLSSEQLRQLAQHYIAEGWEQHELRSVEAVFGPLEAPNDQTVALHSSNSIFEGISLRFPSTGQVIELRGARITVADIGRYSSWEELTERADLALQQFVALSPKAIVNRLAARFINRIPPNVAFTEYEQILERPPQPLPGMEQSGARITNFLRRHVVEGLSGGYTAVLTIGTVNPEAGEEVRQTMPLVVDVDVFRLCKLEANIQVLREDLATIRTLKNELFFGSLKDQALEQFQ